MKIDYLDIAAMVEYIVENAEKQDVLILTISELYDYLEDNHDKHIRVEDEENE
jgi:hypothetical protein